MAKKSKNPTEVKFLVEPNCTQLELTTSRYNIYVTREKGETDFDVTYFDKKRPNDDDAFIGGDSFESEEEVAEQLQTLGVDENVLTPEFIEKLATIGTKAKKRK